MFSIQIPVSIVIVSTVIGVLLLLFFWKYMWPGWMFSRKLKLLIKELGSISGTREEDAAALFETDKVLAHLWSQYKQTLHQQRVPNPRTGIEEVVAVRATVPAEAFFSTQALVDSRLHTEFFKHLPGMFTGAGIIGTFLGVLQGLRAFDVSDDPSLVRQSLNHLLHGVSEAFMVSAAAIFMAMLVTALEKARLSSLYGQVEKLCQRIDSLFKAGAGEEYLERLVCASEDSASQSKILKDALVGELKQILVEITQQQINAALGSQQQLGHQLVQSIETGVRQPLTEIAAGFRNHQQQTGEDISAALRDVLAAFMQRTQDLFGDQVTGINDLQQRTIDALQSAVTHLNQMSVNVDAAGRNATDGMSSRLTEAMNAMEARQQVMNERMAEFVEQIRNLVRESQSETGAKLQGLLADIGQQVGKLVSELHSQVRATSEAHEERQLAFSKTTATTVSGLSTDIQASLGAIQSQFSSMVNSLEQQATRSEGRNDERQSRLAEHAEQTIGNFSSKVAKTVAETSEQNAALLVRLSGLVEAHQTVTADAVRAMQGAVDGISGVTSSAISRMNQGAETMFMAADEFGKSGKSISGVLVEATIIAKELSSSAAAVSSSTRVLEIAVSDYKTVREALSQMVKVLGDLVASAGREASLTADVLARIEMSAQKLAAAQNQADRYLDSVSEILTETHQDFADNMRKTLGEGHKQFFENLSSATSLLREGIQELESVLSGIGEARRVGK